MKRKYAIGFGIGLLLLAVGVLGAAQMQARQRFLTRGWTTEFPSPVADTGMPRACANAALEQYDAAQLAWALDSLQSGGFAWVRQRFAWAEIEPAPGEFSWDRWDAMVNAATAHDLRVIAVLDSAPDWAGAPPDDVAFARFARAFATRYGDALVYYQIWHNPNLGDSWGGRANADEYLALLSAAATAIREADSDARIVLGSLAPTVEVGDRNYAEDVFLEMLYAADGGDYFDVVAAQPYGFFTGPEDRRVGRNVMNFSRAVWVRETLAAHGDDHKAVWVSHFGWNSLPEDWPGPDSIWGNVDATTQAAYTVAALDRATREWPWMGVMCLNGFQPHPASGTEGIPDAEAHWGFALAGPEGDFRPVYGAVRAWAERLQSRPKVAMPGVYNANTSLATFTGPWEFGPLGADMGEHGENRVTLTFEGTDVALTVRRGPYRAFLFVTVDGRPSRALPRDREGRSYVVLYDPLAEIATVPLAENLPVGEHTIEIVAERGWDQWALADWRVFQRPATSVERWGTGAFVALGVLGLALAYWAGRSLDWGTLGQSVSALWRRLREGVRLLISLLLSAVYLFAAWQTLMGEEIFRRLGEGGGMLSLALASGLFYFSPWLLAQLAAGAAVSLIVFVDPALGLALTMLTAPLYMHPLSLLGKSFSLAELILLPTLVGWGVRMLAQRRRSAGPRAGASAPLFLKPVVAFVFIAVVSSLFATHRHEALRELRLVILEPVFFYFALVTLPMERRERWRIVDAFVMSGLLVALYGLLQYFRGDVITAEGGALRLHSLYGSPNNVGLYLGRLFPLLIAVALWSGKRLSPPVTGARRMPGWLRWIADLQIPAFLKDMVHSPRRFLYALALLPVVAALLLSLSRGAIVLGIPAALLTLGVLAGPKWRRVTAVVFVLGVLALIPLLRTPRFAGMFDLSSGTSGFRVSLWYSATGMVRDHPLLGVGPDNFLYDYRTRYVLPTAWEEFNLSHPHNVVMDFASRLGLPGLVVFIWLQVIFWRRVFPLYRPERESAAAFGLTTSARSNELRALALGVMASMADFLGHGLVDASYFVIDLAFVFFLSLAIVDWVRGPSLLDDFQIHLPDPGLDGNL
ncbi:MAG: O-antigen ligase family protein [Anaerolineae bacterium]|nr:O-antigen ligase family protein [Anaerolineae bacterium]